MLSGSVSPRNNQVKFERSTTEKAERDRVRGGSLAYSKQIAKSIADPIINEFSKNKKIIIETFIERTIIPPNFYIKGSLIWQAEISSIVKPVIAAYFEAYLTEKLEEVKIHDVKKELKHQLKSYFNRFGDECLKDILAILARQDS